METRTQRNKRMRRLERKKKFISIIIILSFVFMIIGIYIVNKEIQRKNLIENSNLLKLDLEKREVDFLGKRYYMNFKIISKYLP